MAYLPTKIQQLIDYGYDFQIGDYLSRGWDIYKKGIGGFIGFFILVGVVMVTAGLIPCIGALVFLVLYGPMIIGPAIVANKIERGESWGFGDFFQGFNRFGDMFLVFFLTILLTIAAVIPGYILIFSSILSSASALAESGAMSDIDPDNPFSAFGVLLGMFGSPMFLLGMLLLIAGALYVSVSFYWGPHFAWFHKIPAWDALMTSRKVIQKRWGWVFLFILLLGLMLMAAYIPGYAIIVGSVFQNLDTLGGGEPPTDMLGSMGLGFLLVMAGILLIYPFMACAQYASFSSVTGLNDDDEGTPEVIEHFAPISGQ